MDSVRDYIDAPIRRAVALMNLFGFQTTYSCCGFNYENQNDVMIKDHVLGSTYIRFIADEKTYPKLLKLLNCPIFASQRAWICNIRLANGCNKVEASIYCNFNTSDNNSIWSKGDSPYFHERINCVIKILEDHLLTFRDEFIEVVDIHDYNKTIIEDYPYWQQTPKGVWNITKQYILDNKKV